MHAENLSRRATIIICVLLLLASAFLLWAGATGAGGRF